MAKFTPPTFASLTNESSFIAALNDAMDDIAAALEKTLSRDGTTPNTMSEDLDMNSNRILNVPAPVDDNDLVRLIDLTDGIQGPPGDPGADGAPGGALADGTYNDVVVSSSGTVWTISTALLTAYGRTLTAAANAAAARTVLGLGGAAVLNVGTTAGTVAAADDGRFSRYTVNSQSGATYSFVSTDPGCLVRQTAAGTHTYTIDPLATSNIPVGAVIVLRNAVGAGVLTITPGTGVSIYVNGSTSSSSPSLAAGAVATLVQEATNQWFVVGVGVS